MLGDACLGPEGWKRSWVVYNSILHRLYYQKLLESLAA